MIFTVTPNPSVDRTVVIAELHPGRIMRGAKSWSEPSGKGVNVALALQAQRIPAIAVLPVGGPASAHLTQMLNDNQLDYRAVPIAGEVRVNISLIQPNGIVTKINELGPALTDIEAQAMLDTVAALARPDNWVAGCGSLPLGVDVDYYARLVHVAHAAGARIVIDTSGPALEACLDAQPDLIKPNTVELADASTAPVTTIGDAVDAAQHLRRRGAIRVLASLGGDGALLVDAEGALHGTAHVDRVVSTVGAGDALLAGYLAGPSARREALHRALVWGASAVQHRGTVLTDVHYQRPVEISETIPEDQKLRRNE